MEEIITHAHAHLNSPNLQTTMALWVQSRMGKNKHMNGPVTKHIFMVFQDTKEKEKMLKDSGSGRGIGSWTQRWFLVDKRIMPSWFVGKIILNPQFCSQTSNSVRRENKSILRQIKIKTFDHPRSFLKELMQQTKERNMSSKDG